VERMLAFDAVIRVYDEAGNVIETYQLNRNKPTSYLMRTAS